MIQGRIILPMPSDTDAVVVFKQRPSQEAIEKLIEYLEFVKDTYPTRNIKTETVSDKKAV